MKKLLLAIFSSLPLLAQVPCNISGNFTATGDSIILDNRNNGCYQWRVAYTSTGFSGISISLQTATTSTGSFADFAGATVVTDGANPSTSTSGAIIGIHANGAFIKLHLATATGTGKVIYQVWGANLTSNIAGLTGTGSGVTSVTASAPLTSSGGATPNISASYQGNGAKIQASTGTTTTNDCVKFDANGNTVDAGAACGSSSGGFTTQTDVTGSRAVNAIFQNTTGKMLQVIVVANNPLGVTGNYTGFSQSVNPPTYTPFNQSVVGAAFAVAVTIQFMVPNTYFYEITVPATASLVQWTEYN